MQNKKNIILAVGFVAVAIVFFFIGSSYANNKNNANVAQNQNTMGIKNGAQRGMRNGGGVFGKVVAKDATSITVQLSMPGQGGADVTQTGTGSKIVFYTDQTPVMKTTAGSINDIVVGSNVSVNGQANADGSVNAQSISLRPNMPNGPKQ